MQSQSTQDLLQNIENFKSTYYTENKKNMFFKTSQKMDCAEKIATEFDLNDLLNKTVYILPYTNRVYLDYTVFKLFANPNNYTHIVDHVLSLFQQCIDKYGSFECHFNLNSFTITAAERYKSIIEMFCKECLKGNTRYAKMLSKMHIYYTPSIFEKITSMFSKLIDPLIRERFTIYTKEESDTKLKELFA